MVRRMRDYAGSSNSERFVARRVADELKLADRVAADAIRDVTTGREYSFLVSALLLVVQWFRFSTQYLAQYITILSGQCLQAAVLLLGGALRGAHRAVMTQSLPSTTPPSPRIC